MSTKLRRLGAIILILALVAMPMALAYGKQEARADPAPIFNVNSQNAIPDRYIVVFRADAPGNAPDQAADAAAAQGGTVHYRYTAAIRGFAATLPAQALEGIQHNPNVDYIEADQVVTLDTTLDTTQTGATWGLDRIDQRNLPLDSSYTYNTTGAGVNVYIIDTGIRTTHTEFGGRAVGGYTAINDGNGTNDCNGHGTHVAGTVGGSTYGVAKGVGLVAVRVLDCSGSGTTSGVIAGIDWVTANHTTPAAANMSLGGGASSALDTAVNNSINSGVTYAIAAGNSNANACNYSPARVAAAITVGSTTSTDARSSFSNYGTCLDLFAPGSSITSAWNTSDTATNTISGTSMATPHVAGVAALYLGANPSASPSSVRNAIVNGATANVLTGIGTGSPNLLLYSLLTGAPGPTPTPTSPPSTPTPTPVPPTPTPTSPGPTPTPAPPTPTPVPPTPTSTPSGANIIVNPGFENGTTGWTQYSSGGYQIITTTRPHTGSYSAYLCGYNYCTEYVQQQITVPGSGVLTYWWYMSSNEGAGAAYDYLRVRLYTTGGSLIATLRTWSNTSTRNTWSQDTISLAAYAGQTVVLRFVSTTDSSLTSSFFVDDVSVK